MLLQVEQETPEYWALKKYEDELIESLSITDVASLKKRAIEMNLIPNDLVSHVQNLDPNVQWPHPLIYRFLFYCVCTTAYTQTPALALPYKKWLSLLSDLQAPAVSGVLFRLNQHVFGIESILVNRASPSGEGYTLNIDDVPILVKVLLDDWKESHLMYSLLLSNDQIKHLKTIMQDTPAYPVLELLTMWGFGAFSNVEVLTLENLARVLCSPIVDLGDQADWLRKHLVSKVSKGALNERDISVVSQVLADSCINKWKEIAFTLLLPAHAVEQILSMTNTMPSMKCLMKLLTMWVMNEFPNARLPTFENLVRIFNQEKASQIRQDVIKQSLSKRSCEGDFDMTLKTSDFKHCIAEECSVLMEVQVITSSEDPVFFEWFHEESVVNFPSAIVCIIKNHYNSTVTGILCFQVKDLLAEGAYRCVAKQNAKVLESQPIILTTVNTPLNPHKRMLTDFYTEQPEVPEDTWPPVGGNTYISLALIKQESIKGAGEYGFNTIRGDIDDIYNDKESIIYDKAFSKLGSGARLLVEGRPGSGKTTLVHKISQEWATGKLVLLHNKLLLLVHLRAFSSNPDIGLLDVLKCYFSVQSTVNTIVEYAEKHNGLGLCFILDGLDEYTPNETDTFIFKLIRKQVLPKATVIVASRPAAAANFRKMATRQIEVIGFLKEQIYEYIKKYPFSEASKCDNLLAYFNQHPNILHTCYLPIHAAMVCFLSDNLKSDLPETETEIYEEFTKYTILRTLYRSKNDKQMYLESIEDLSTLQRTHFYKICELAYEMIVSSKQVIKQAEVQSFFKLQEERDSFGLVSVDRMATRLGFQSMYAFLHLTFQEFLAACFVSNLEEAEQIGIINQQYKNRNFQQVWKFYCGLARSAEQSRALVISKIECGSLYKVQCCFESQQVDVCDMAVEDNCLSFSETFLSPSNFTEIAYVISHTSQNPVERLTFEGCTFGSEGIDVLVERAGSNLTQVTSLCCYKCDHEQLRMINHFLHSLTWLEVLDISNTNIGDEEVAILSNGLNHSNLQVLKIGSEGCELNTSLQELAEIFKSSCSNFTSICFSGDGKHNSVEDVLPSSPSSPSSLYLYSEVPDLNLKFCSLRLSAIKALSYELMRTPHYTKIILVHCGIGDTAIQYLSLGMKYCYHLKLLELSFNSISDDGAVHLVDSCSKLQSLDLSFNRISDKGAMSLLEAFKNGGCQLFFIGNDISNDILQYHKIDCSTLRLSDRAINDREAGDLSEALQLSLGCTSIHRHLQDSLHVQPSSLLVLDLSCNSISTAGAELLCAVLKICTKLLKLDVSYNHLGCAGAEAIAGAIGHCVRLLELKMNSNCISNDGAVAIAEGLKHCMFLQELQINSNNVGSFGAKAIAKAMEHWETFCALDISNNDLRTAGFKALFSTLEGCSTVRVLNFSCTLEHFYPNLFIESLKFCREIERLLLDSNSIGIEGAKNVASSLKYCSSLQEFSLSSNHLCDVGARVIADALSVHCSKLCVLDISDNSIGSKGLYHVLTAVLKGCPRLSELNISCNVNVKTVDFTEALKHGSSITKLDISNNSLGMSHGVLCDFSMFKHCTNLVKLHAGSNNLGDSEVQLLCNNLNDGLQVLDLSSNRITDNGALWLAEALEHCMKHISLNFQSNAISSTGAEALMALRH